MSNKENIVKAPLVFEPYLKSVIWGGNKICAFKGIKQKEPNIGESWEISAVPGHESVVAEGIYKGQNLTKLIDRFGADLLGTKVVERYGLFFPLLVKFIDACDDLSVQVHPDDELARQRHNSLGKTEMWYIISTEPGAKIYAGLKDKLSPQTYTERVKNGTFADALAVHESNSGDIFFLPAGRVHAIGAGNLLAEIQESSDITYRIYDYDRRDKNGNPRELHTDLAKDAIDYRVYDDYRSIPVRESETVTSLVKCSHFSTQLVNLDNEEMHLRGDGTTFHVVIVLKGEIEISTSEGNITLAEGYSALIPAAVDNMRFSGTGNFLLAKV